MVTKYRRKPEEIEAFKFYYDNIPDWFMDEVTKNNIILHNCDRKMYSAKDAICEINVKGDFTYGYGGDYIIKTSDGEIYACDPEVFIRVYEKISL